MNDYRNFNPSTGEFEKSQNDGGGFELFFTIGYWIVAVIMGFIWVPEYGWVLGIIRSLFWGLIAMFYVFFHVLSWLYDLIF